MIGKTLAHYKITSLLGKGGMGEVFRATDTKLGRDVALKILPQEMSGDPERAARFDREARSLAMLQHPNVASIYGFEEHDGVRFLVMELVEGEDLSEHLKNGKPSVEETARIAKQMAAGLEAAHEKGIVHRDLKPANVMFTSQGDIKILDFGLARAWFGDGAEKGDLETSPTITAAMTQAGTILGTAAYMSPEQARGRNVDRRADIWAFGVIVWEMLTGEKLFEGETISDTLAAVLRAEPDWDKLPVDDAPELCRLVERCLVRDPRQRLRDIGEARLRLEGGSSQTRLSMPQVDEATFETAPPTAKSPWPMVAIVGLVALAAGFAVGWFTLRGNAPVESAALHLMIPPPKDAEFDLRGAAPGPTRLSPDGRMAAFTAYDDQGITRLYLRHLDREESLVVPGTEDAAYPFWSPDSQYIGFFTPNGSGKLKKVAIAGGPAITLCNASNGKGGTWSEQGAIVFAPSHDTPLLRVPEIGGEPDTLTHLEDRVGSHRHPRFLPDGEHFLYLARLRETSTDHSVRLGSLSEGDLREVAISESQAEYDSGHLLTTREGILMATPFDLVGFETVGGSFPLVEGIMISSSGSAVGAYSFSNNEIMTYQTGSVATERGLMWTDLEDGTTALLNSTGNFAHPRISPDGQRAMIEVRGEANESVDLWMVDLNNGLRTRFTFEDTDEVFPVWTPDGKSVIYSSLGTDRARLLRRPVDSAGGVEELLNLEKGYATTTDIGPAGRWLYFDNQMSSGKVSLFRLDLSVGGGLAAIDTLLNTEQHEGGGRVSPDGRWVAYHTESASRWDIFVRPVEGGERKWQITTDGQVWPQWSADGSELYTCSFVGGISAYSITASSESIVVGSPRSVAIVSTPDANGVEYSVDPNGGRILSVTDPAQDRDSISYIHVVTNWRQALVR